MFSINWSNRTEILWPFWNHLIFWDTEMPTNFGVNLKNIKIYNRAYWPGNLNVKGWLNEWIAEIDATKTCIFNFCGEHLCQVLLNSYHKWNSYEADNKLFYHIWPWTVTLTFYLARWFDVLHCSLWQCICKLQVILT